MPPFLFETTEKYPLFVAQRLQGFKWSRLINGAGDMTSGPILSSQSYWADRPEARTAGLNRAQPANNAAAAPTQGGGGFLSLLRGLVDIINPLQHIPVVNTFYRHLTGDEISPAAKIAGGTLYGGPVGGGLALADVAFENISGHDAGETVLAAFIGGDEPSPVADETIAPVMLASAQPLTTTTAFPAGLLTQPEGLNQPERATSPAAQRGPYTPSDHAARIAVSQSPVIAPAEVSLPQSRLTAATVTPVLALHEAPVTGTESDLPPALIAERMNMALDKYAAMKSRGL